MAVAGFERGGGPPPRSVWNNDAEDRSVWVQDAKQTWSGDVDLNGEFNSSDLAHVFVAGAYDGGKAAGGTEGDRKGDGIFDNGEFVIAFEEG